MRETAQDGRFWHDSLAVPDSSSLIRSLKGYIANNWVLLAALSIKDYTSFNLVFPRLYARWEKKSFTLNLKKFYE